MSHCGLVCAGTPVKNCGRHLGGRLCAHAERLPALGVAHPLYTNETATDGAGPVDIGLGTVDHFAVCVEPGQLKPAIEFYETVLDFDMMFTERIVVGAQAMDSMVMQSKSGAVTLTVIEPDLTRESGQIDQFLKDHGGAGVQHIVLTAANIVTAIDLMNRNGVEFLSTPKTYYDMVTDRLALSRYSVEQLRDLSILVDEDQDGQLLQIFAKPVHPRGTPFYEVIERLGARTFGSGNIKALYAAAQRQMEQVSAAH
jgi:4-hydroxymandelate synthase